MNDWPLNAQKTIIIQSINRWTRSRVKIKKWLSTLTLVLSTSNLSVGLFSLFDNLNPLDNEVSYRRGTMMLLIPVFIFWNISNRHLYIEIRCTSSNCHHFFLGIVRNASFNEHFSCNFNGPINKSNTTRPGVTFNKKIKK